MHKQEREDRSADRTGELPSPGRSLRGRAVLFCLPSCTHVYVRRTSLPIPSRDEILSSPVREYGDVPGTTSSFTVPTHRPPTPVMDDPSDELDRELARAQAGKR